MRKVKKKEYFTFMFLPGPDSRIRTVSISKGVIQSILLSFLAILIISLYMIYEYNDMKDKIYEMNAIKKELQGSTERHRMDDILSYWSAVPEVVNFKPVLIFMGCTVLSALMFYTIAKLMRMMAASRALAIKNKLIEDFCAALDNSPINPSAAKGSNNAGK